VRAKTNGVYSAELNLLEFVIDWLREVF